MKIFTFIHKYFWRIICSVIAFCLLVITFFIVMAWLTDGYEYQRPLNDKFGYYNSNKDSYIYIYDLSTKERVLCNVELIGEPHNGDSIEVFVWKDTARPFNIGDKRGYLNSKRGNIIVYPQFDKAWIFSSGVAAVCNNDSVYFIDTNGRRINDRKFPYAKGHDYIFYGDFCQIKVGDKYGMIDKRGEWVVEPIWDAVIDDITHAKFLLYKDGNRTDVSYIGDSIMKAPILEFRGDTILVPFDTTVVYIKQTLY